MHKNFALVGIVSFLTGCASSSMDYRPPSAQNLQNTKEVSVPFDQAWDSLVRQLSSDFFVINNIDKNSRLINISFSSQRPSEFVDCGITNRTFDNARGKTNYSYVTADSTAFSIVNKQSIVFNVTRKTKLEGRVNIYVAPTASGTSLVVNTKYAVMVNANLVSFDGAQRDSANNTFDFSTKQGYSSPEISCYAKGTLEQRILSMVN